MYGLFSLISLFRLCLICPTGRHDFERAGRKNCLPTGIFSFISKAKKGSDKRVMPFLFQNSLRTHPDKNPDNPSATAEFQRVAEAYQVLLKHLHGPTREDSFSGAHPFFNAHHHYHEDSEEEDSYSDDDFYDDDYLYDDEDDDEDLMAFYL